MAGNQSQAMGPIEDRWLACTRGRSRRANRELVRARPDSPGVPEYLAQALKANPKAWRFLRGLARTYQRPFVLWVHTAKREETRENRLREAIRLLASGKKLGLK